MDGKSCLVWLLVTLAVIRRLAVISSHSHQIGCIMTATISETFVIEECPGSCVCNREKGSTMVTCSLGGMSGKEVNLDIETKLTNLTSYITALSISREPVTDSVPIIICQMQILEVLDLSSNSISDLPIGCLTKLKRLRTMNLMLNRISTLKRGTVEGLQQLEELILYRNGLVSIDPEIFANRSDLVSLNNLDFTYGEIASVDA